MNSKLIYSKGGLVVNWTVLLRQKMATIMRMDTWMPLELPEYAQGFAYTLGSLTTSSVVVLVISGVILAANGPQWWTTSATGSFVRSVHFWSVQCFFLFMVLHLFRAFFTAAWRGGRARTWVLGALALLIAIPTAFTGYLLRGDFFSQWNAVQAKDGINALGFAWFNVLNSGQMFGLHVVVLPLVLLAIVVVHISLVRVKGVVSPYPSKAERMVNEQALKEEKRSVSAVS